MTPRGARETENNAGHEPAHNHQEEMELDNQVVKLTDQALVKILERVVADDGKITPDDAAAASLFCRIGQSQSGAAYPFFSTAAIKDWNGALAHAGSGADGARA